MELAYNLGFFDLRVKHLVAFVLPLFFAGVLQNLVVSIGKTASEKGNIDFKEIFDRFKFQVQESLLHAEKHRKIGIQNQLISSSIPTKEILQQCRLYLGEDEFKFLSKRIDNLPEERKRIEIVKILGIRAGIEALISLIPDTQHQ